MDKKYKFTMIFCNNSKIFAHLYKNFILNKLYQSVYYNTSLNVLLF